MCICIAQSLCFVGVLQIYSKTRSCPKYNYKQYKRQMKNIDQYYMQQALTIAKRGKYTVSPNPMVGCLIVNNGRIIGEGHHQLVGEAHAEVYALQQAGNLSKGATAYITLEPCCHVGRTPPCTEALIKAGISKVVIAILDPNPKVTGNGVQKLKDANIDVNVGILEIEARKLNKIFFHYQKNNQPFVFAKWAMALDGKMAVNGDDSPKLTSTTANKNTHQLRNLCDAILVGKNTLIIDNPRLDTRLDIPKALYPIRFVLFSKLDFIDESWQVLDQSIATTIFVCTNISNTAKKTRAKHEIEYWLLPIAKNHICLDSLLNAMGNTGITSLLVEGGMKTLKNFIDDELVNEFHSYISPFVIANSNPKKKLKFKKATSLGKDILINASFKEQENV
jgi:diaminohydroxyphosphoribosylaminopyrimidine deaminase/5-amino-6-(5-phosphoribosylamino)uracil reductase